MSDLRTVVGQVLEGFTLPTDVRKILESAYYQEPQKGGYSAGYADGLKEGLEEPCPSCGWTRGISGDRETKK